MKEKQASDHYDVIVIGGGLGGLLCAVLLAKEGRKVCVLEKNRQIGGCLQTFAFNKQVFDSSVHYIGGLGEGHTLHRIFRYAGIIDKLKLAPLDPDGFDRIAFGDEPVLYPHANGEEGFVQHLLPFFPEEEAALRGYIRSLQEVGDRFPLYRLRSGSSDEKASVYFMELTEVIRGLTSNQRLHDVLLGTSMLYAGAAGRTPFYLHALVAASYIHSAHKVLPGSSEISKALWRVLQQHGSEIVRRADVISLEEKDGLISAAVAADGRSWTADHFISAIHPAALMPLIPAHLLRPVYRKRMSNPVQTPPAVVLNVVLKKGRVPYRAYNLYWHPDGRVVGDEEGWPPSLAFFFSKDKAAPAFASSVSIIMYADWADWTPWADTFQTEGVGAERADGYSAFKHNYADSMLQKAVQFLPELQDSVEAMDLSTPVTYRDYTGTPEGSLYGVLKDVNAAASGSGPVRTRIPNLLLTGQNVNLHGVLGVSITAVATCAELLGQEHLLDRINNP